MKTGIKTTIMVWYSVLSLIIMATFFIFIYLMFSHSLFKEARGSLESDAQRAASETEIVWDAVKLKTDFSIHQTSIIVYSVDNRVLMGDFPYMSELSPSIVDGGIYSVYTDKSSWLVCDMPLLSLRYNGWIRAIKPLDPILNNLRNLRIIIMLSLPVYILITAFGGYQIAKRAFLPISKIVQTVKQIGNGDLSKRIALVNVNDEIGDLANTLDDMLDKLEESFLREKQFANDASHELRTPVSVIMSYSEDALSCEKTQEEYLSAMQVILGESLKVKTIISSLLMLAHSYEEKSQLFLEKINLSTLLEIVVDEALSSCENKSVTVNYNIEQDIYSFVDQTLMARIFFNLIENAIKYNKQNGNITVCAKTQNNLIVVSVEDTGIGIASDEQALIFSRFYRTDKSKNGSSHGLGLSIVKWMVEAHDGKISVKSKLGVGSTFTIEIPLTIL